MQMSGTNIFRSEDSRFTLRGSMHVLISGESGLAKTQLLRYVFYTVPRSIFFSAKGSSGAGLESVLYRDVIAGDPVFTAGLLSLCDDGICCLDQFDFLKGRDGGSLGEVMELQSMTVTKAGLITTLKSRVGLLCSGNLSYSRFLNNFSIERNFSKSKVRLYRFDVILILRQSRTFVGDFILSSLEAGEEEKKDRIFSVFSRSPFLGTELGGMFGYKEYEYSRYFVTRTVSCRRRKTLSDFSAVGLEVIRHYVETSKGVYPNLSQEILSGLSLVHVSMRNEDICNLFSFVFNHVRCIISLLRLCQSHARLGLFVDLS